MRGWHLSPSFAKTMAAVLSSGTTEDPSGSMSSVSEESNGTLKMVNKSDGVRQRGISCQQHTERAMYSALQVLSAISDSSLLYQ